jgi:hypothetical protein
VLERNVVEHGAAPQRERLAIPLTRGGEPARAPLVARRHERRAKARRVELLVVDAEDITATLVMERRVVAVGGEHAAESRDVRMDALPCGRGDLVAPELVHQPFDRDRPVRVEQQGREEHLQLLTRDGTLLAADEDLQPTEDPKLGSPQAASRVTSPS